MLSGPKPSPVSEKSGGKLEIKEAARVRVQFKVLQDMELTLNSNL